MQDILCRQIGKHVLGVLDTERILPRGRILNIG